MAQSLDTATIPPWAANIKAVLATQGRTISWLAAKVGIHQSLMSRMLGVDPRYRVSADLKHKMAEANKHPERLQFCDGVD